MIIVFCVRLGLNSNMLSLAMLLCCYRILLLLSIGQNEVLWRQFALHCIWIVHNLVKLKNKNFISTVTPRNRRNVLASSCLTLRHISQNKRHNDTTQEIYCTYCMTVYWILRHSVDYVYSRLGCLNSMMTCIWVSAPALAFDSRL